jgi:colicin import membrane protein
VSAWSPNHPSEHREFFLKAVAAIHTRYHDSYGVSLAVSILLHALLFAILFWSWHQPSSVILETPKYVQARLVKLASQAPAVTKPVTPVEVTPPEVAKPVVHDIHPKETAKPPVAKPQAKPEVQKQNAEKIRQKALQEEKLKQQQLEKQKQEDAEKAARAKAAQEKQQADAELAREMADENAQQQSSVDNKLVASFKDKIGRDVEQHWNLPLSARKGMEVLMEIQLVPTGYVVGVKIVKGSGNEAFDLSAQQAVLRFRDEPLPEVKEIPPQIFEQHFRHFQILFHPEDAL